MIQKYVLPLLAVAALSFAVLYVINTQKAAPEVKPYEEPASKPAGTAVAGSGIVEPVAQNIAVGSNLPGVVTWVIGLDQVGKPLAKGDILFQLDDRQQKAEIEVRQSALASSQAQLDRLNNQPRKEEIGPLEARLKEVQANLQDQEDQFQRSRRLYERKALSEDDFQRRKFVFEAVRQQAHKAQADLKLLLAGAWDLDKAVTGAAVKQAEAQLKQAQTELERLTVRAQADSELLQVNVRPGEYVGAQPGQSLILLGNVSNLHVRVDIDEHDAPRYRPGAPATAYVRGQTGYPFPLEFVRVEPYIVPKKSLTGDNSERVDTRVLQVIYRLKKRPDKAHPVYIGQQMDVFIDEAAKPAPEQP